MHAMMSETATEGWGEVHRFVVTYRTTDLRADLAAGAMDEARRILATTERGGVRYAGPLALANGAYRARYEDAQHSMAESLAAFVAADDAAEFLRARA